MEQLDAVPGAGLDCRRSFVTPTYLFCSSPTPGRFITGLLFSRMPRLWVSAIILQDIPFAGRAL